MASPRKPPPAAKKNAPAKKPAPAAKKPAPAAKKPAPAAKKPPPAAKKSAPAKKAAPAAAKPAPAKKAPDFAARIAKIEAAAKKAGVALPKGASKEAIAAAEAKLGVALPAEVRAFYLAHDGGPSGELVCGNRELLSLEGMVRQWALWKEGFDAGDLEDDDAEPDEGVQREWWIPAWIPVTYDFSGNHDMIDLDPDEGGEVGQIVAVWHDDSARTLEGTSFLSWLEEQEWGREEG